MHRRARNGLDIVILFEHLLQWAVFVFVRLGDQVEVSDVRLVGRRWYSVAQQWSDPAVNPVARSDTIQREPHLRSKAVTFCQIADISNRNHEL